MASKCHHQKQMATQNSKSPPVKSLRLQFLVTESFFLFQLHLPFKNKDQKCTVSRYHREISCVSSMMGCKLQGAVQEYKANYYPFFFLHLQAGVRNQCTWKWRVPDLSQRAGSTGTSKRDRALHRRPAEGTKTRNLWCYHSVIQGTSDRTGLIFFFTWASGFLHKSVPEMTKLHLQLKTITDRSRIFISQDFTWFK